MRVPYNGHTTKYPTRVQAVSSQYGRGVRRDKWEPNPLGAKPRDVINMILGNGLRLTLAGVVAGVAGAVALSRVLAGFVYGVSPLDPATYTAAVGLLAAVAALSAYRPSRQAAAMDPLVVLRDE